MKIDKEHDEAKEEKVESEVAINKEYTEQDVKEWKAKYKKVFHLSFLILFANFHLI